MIGRGEPVGAYCCLKFKDHAHVEIMDIEEIKRAWSNSDSIKYGKGKETIHDKFTGEMMKKTVIKRACKAYINSSGFNVSGIPENEYTDLYKSVQNDTMINHEPKAIEIDFKEVDNDKEASKDECPI